MFDFIKKLLGQPSVDLKEVLSNGAILLDVRTPQEFKSGHAKGAVNIPVDKIGSKIAQLKQKNKPIVVYCKSGMRSKMAVSMLKGNDVKAYNAGSLGAARKLIG